MRHLRGGATRRSVGGGIRMRRLGSKREARLGGVSVGTMWLLWTGAGIC